jgi:hypothetical protein
MGHGAREGQPRHVLGRRERVSGHSHSIPVPARVARRWARPVLGGVVMTAMAVGAVAVLDREQPATRIRTPVTAAAAATIEIAVESREQLAAPGFGPTVVASAPNVVWVGGIHDARGASALPVLAIDPRTGDTISSTAVADTVMSMTYGLDALWTSRCESPAAHRTARCCASTRAPARSRDGSSSRARAAGSPSGTDRCGSPIRFASSCPASIPRR